MTAAQLRWRGPAGDADRERSRLPGLSSARLSRHRTWNRMAPIHGMMHGMGYPEITPFEVSGTEIDGLFILQMKQITDERGTVREFYRESAFVEGGLPSLGSWLQINVTESGRGAIRGLHGEDTVKAGRGCARRGIRRICGCPGRVAEPWQDGHRAASKRVAGARTCRRLQRIPVDHRYAISLLLYVGMGCGMGGAAVNPFDPSLGIDWPLPIDSTDARLLSAKDQALPPLDR